MVRHNDYLLGSFNPRSRAGSDLLRRGLVCLLCVSIHAPARGATPSFLGLYPLFQFQSTLPRGERLRLALRSVHSMAFQSTLPRGERPAVSPRSASPTGFQSTLPRGERRPCVAGIREVNEFQSTLPRGERHQA